MHSRIPRRFLLLGSRKGPDGVPSIFHVSASEVSPPELKHFLDGKFPGQYSVKLKRDEFTITLREQIPISKIS
ncbi:hypothetical protein F4775DRAFT_543828 [Biscogniauxia sp. FL1348]|nr:hypothetical protein F4775DRAFT_543828 [Biscogniauxia sp. FL1348]